MNKSPHYSENVAKDMSRRAFTRGAALALAASGLELRSLAQPKKMHVAVIGAGAFGGWTALQLQRRGARVTLIDAWGPGNSRASSGGETRVIRATYANAVYVDMTLRALELWRENEKRWGLQLLHPTGVIWMSGKGDTFVPPAISHLKDRKLSFEQWTPAEASRRYPQIDFSGIEFVLFERNAGFLLARRACEAVWSAFVKEGGEHVQSAVEPGEILSGELKNLKLSDGSHLTADRYVFACGPWLGKLFPDVIGNRITPTRQEVFFFGTPAGDQRFTDAQMPVWADSSDTVFYGIPGNQWRGFKMADDTRGPVFDPTNGERTVSPEGLRTAREYLRRRFPALRDAPLVESRVCQYENSPDGNYILDWHPHARNVWLAGGGSGAGFKHGPAVGEHIARCMLGDTQPNQFFALARLKS